MKYLFLALFFTIFIIGCGTDTIINNNTTIDPVTNDSLIYQYDSLGIITSDTGYVNLLQGLFDYFYNNDTCSIKITFTGNTNMIDTSVNWYGMGYTVKYGFDNVSHSKDLFTSEQINKNHSYRLDNVMPNSRIFVATSLIRNQMNIPAYIYFKNIKIYKIIQ